MIGNQDIQRADGQQELSQGFPQMVLGRGSPKKIPEHVIRNYFPNTKGWVCLSTNSGFFECKMIPYFVYCCSILVIIGRSTGPDFDLISEVPKIIQKLLQ